jgi:hypothetical protein
MCPSVTARSKAFLGLGDDNVSSSCMGLETGLEYGPDLTYRTPRGPQLRWVIKMTAGNGEGRISE